MRTQKTLILLFCNENPIFTNCQLISEQLLARRTIGGHFARKPKKKCRTVKKKKYPGLFYYDLPGHKVHFFTVLAQS